MYGSLVAMLEVPRARSASGFRPNKTRPASFLNGFKNVCIISQIFI